MSMLLFKKDQLERVILFFVCVKLLFLWKAVFWSRFMVPWLQNVEMEVGWKVFIFFLKMSCDKGGMHQGKICLLSSFHCLSSVQNSKPKSNQIMDHMWTVSLCFMATVYDKRTVTCKHQDKWRDWLICVTSGCVVKSNLARETLICSTLRR